MSLTDRPELDKPIDLDLDNEADDNFFQTLLRADDLVIDINENRVDLAPFRTDSFDSTGTPMLAPAAPATDEPAPDVDPGNQARHETPDRREPDREAIEHADAPQRPAGRPVAGMRLRRVRLRSVVKVASLFFVIAYLSLVGTGVALWNLAQRLGLITDTENLVTTSLGLDSFDVSGAQLFDMVTIGAGVLCALGLMVTVLLAVVYNVAGMLFGGLAFETAPLKRRPGLVRRTIRRLRPR